MRFRFLPLLAAIALALAACGGGGTDDAADAGGDSAGSSEPGVISFVGDDQLQWAETEKTVEAVDGAFEVEITCEGAVPHNVVFEGVQDDAIIAECEGNDTATGSVELEPGTYTYYCNIPGHREAGMEGTLTVS